ncbi:hypothetical protein ACROYT_G012067 [Oculina patagonica]
MQLREGTGREVFFVSLENYFKSKFLGSFPEVGITVVIEISFINCGCLLGVCPPRITVHRSLRKKKFLDFLFEQHIFGSFRIVTVHDERRNNLSHLISRQFFQQVTKIFQTVSINHWTKENYSE